MPDKFLISIIVTSYTVDRLKANFELLDSIKSQNYSNLEIIYIIERSKELFQNISSYIVKINMTKIKLVFNDGETGASAARNLGMRQSHGDIIAFIDDDVVLASDWAKEMVETYDDNTIIGVSGTAMPLWECPEPKWLPREFYWIVGSTSWLTSREKREIRNVWTMNSSFRREIADKGIFFSPSIGPDLGSMVGRAKFKLSEDLEFSLRVKDKTRRRIVFNPRVNVLHRVPVDRVRWKYIIQWSYWIGSSRNTLKRLYPESHSKSLILSAEYNLLGSIFKSLLPSILKQLFSAPLIAGHKFALTITVLSCITIGYFQASIFYRRSEGKP